MWIERTLRPTLRGLAKSFPVIVLAGPRQIGKTSLLERTFDDFTYVSLDVVSHAELAETRPDEFLARFPPPLLLDEIQHAPAMFRFIKATVDAQRGETGLFVLTGSQDFRLMQSVSESLAGRAAVLPFLGLSAEEWSANIVLRDAFDWREFLWRGSFPALWAVPNSDTPRDASFRDRWYQGYVATYLERDVRNLLNIGSLRDFERFLRACASRVGQMLNMSDLARDVGISPSTSGQWISLLQASGQIFLLEPYHRALGKRLAKSPKLYFTDTGLAAFLNGYASADALWRSPQAGAFFENHVTTQWLRWRYWQEPSTTIWYWRDRTHEVDLVIERNGRLYPIECKLSDRPSNRDAKGIRRLRAFYGEDLVADAAIACTVESAYDIEDGLAAQSGWTTWPLD